jgi:chemotaxis signal transduction protein
MLEQIQSNLVTALLIVRIQDKEFCFDMNDIQTIINPFRANSTYKNGDTKTIIYDYTEIPIINFASLFSLESGNEVDSRILVLKKQTQSIGFFVDEVKELITFNRDGSEKLNLLPTSPDNPNLIGNVYYKNQLFLFPDIAELFNQYLPQ